MPRRSSPPRAMGSCCRMRRIPHFYAARKRPVKRPRVRPEAGFRSRFRDWCSEQGFPRDLVARAYAYSKEQGRGSVSPHGFTGAAQADDRCLGGVRIERREGRIAQRRCRGRCALCRCSSLVVCYLFDARCVPMCLRRRGWRSALSATTARRLYEFGDSVS